MAKSVVSQFVRDRHEFKLVHRQRHSCYNRYSGLHATTTVLEPQVQYELDHLNQEVLTNDLDGEFIICAIAILAVSKPTRHCSKGYLERQRQ